VQLTQRTTQRSGAGHSLLQVHVSRTVV
jgi:hypothetical protein